MRAFSLKQKLLSMILGLSTVVLALFALMAYQGYTAVISGKQAQVKSAAESVLDKIDRNLFERYGDVQAYALSEPARSGNPERIQKFMDDMMVTYAPIYDVMMMMNREGRVIAVNRVDKNGKKIDSSSLLGADFSSATWFKAAIAQDFKAGTAHVEDLQIDPETAEVANTDGRVMVFSSPVRDASGKTVGVWTNKMSWKDVVEAIIKEESQQLVRGNITAASYMIVGADGKYLVHPRGKSVELVKTHSGFEALVGNLKTGTHVGYGVFPKSGEEAIEAAAKGKGYSSYPGKGWTALVHVPVTDPTLARDRQIIAMAFVTLLLVNIAAIYFVGSTSKRFETIIRQLAENARRMNTSSHQLSNASQQLAAATHQQATAIEKTAASTEEMSSMIAQTSKHAENSLEVAERGRSNAKSGRAAISDLSVAMTEIESSNSKMNDLVKLINDINDKTRIINEIVSETRLLSFNASIEAARAGVHGKGFAVVAEEVGKLATISGNAANEIRSLLSSSTEEVAKIVRLTQESLNGGKTAAHTCESTFTAMFESLEKISDSVNMIASATKEQEIGIQQTNQAMVEMDHSTNSNSKGSEDLSNQAHSLSEGATSLQKSVESLTRIVLGTKAKPANKSETQLVASTAVAAPTLSHSPAADATASAPSAPVSTSEKKTSRWRRAS